MNDRRFLPTLLPTEFEPVFRYTLVDGKAMDCEVLNQELWQKSGAVYARVHDGEVLYVGKADGKLSRRLTAHVNGISVNDPANPTARKYKEWAKAKGQPVTITIYAHKPQRIRICEHDVEVHAGLEHALITALKPPFVRRR